jgi:membrane protein DedA with SNARE-associated domain
MHPNAYLASAIGGSLGHPFILSLVIVLGTFVLEDPTIILTSDGLISVPTALFSLYAGVILGDLFFFSIGRYASTHPRFAHYVDHEYVAPVRVWLETRYVLTVFSARFIPGSRLPTYAASGFIGKSFSTFFMTVILATSLWTTVLFGLSYWMGAVTAQWLHQERWVIAAFVIAVIAVVSHLNVIHKRLRKGFLVEKSKQ